MMNSKNTRIGSTARISAVITLAAAICLFTGCGSGAMDNVGQLAGNLANVPPRSVSILDDLDYDGIPNEIEEQIGTDPNNNDTDNDGLTDQYELWGAYGVPVGTIGSLDNLPDLDGDGVIAPLDRKEAGKVLLKSTSALDQDRIRVPYPGIDPQPANDLDGDWIPSDFELHGFYYEFDPVTGEDWFVKWNGDISKPYAKTDPTKWSTDGDPWSDWEEMTKINLDQRVKSPGDHPDIPAYPEIFVALSSYQIELNEDTTVTSSNGQSAEDSWTHNVDVVNKSTVINGGGFGLELKGKIGTLSGLSFKAEGEYHHKWGSFSSSVTTDENSGLTAKQWSNATITSGNSLEVARITLNVNVMNTGTLPASNPQILCNLKLGNEAITSFLIGYDGELKPQLDKPVQILVSTDGFASGSKPVGEEMYLSANQLRSFESGAPIDIEVVSFEADTLVWQVDPDTGRRLFITEGDWSPYESAIKNVTAKFALDFSANPALQQPLYHGMPAKKVPDIRIFGYDNTGNYTGSPPTVRLGDALLWGFNAKQLDDGDITVTFTDPVTKTDFTSSIYGWTFSFDQRIWNDVLNFVTPVSNIFDFPVRPGNPYEYTYVATAPPPGELAKPKIYWSNLDLNERKVRAFSMDVRGIKEMRFVPREDYLGEVMQLGLDLDDPESPFFYTYDIPSQYQWTGLEKVVAVNNVGKETVLDVDIVGDVLGNQVAGDTLLLSFIPDSGTMLNEKSLNLEVSDNNAMVSAPFDVTLVHERDAGNGNVLTARLEPMNGAGVYDIGLVADIDELDYNYLRKRPYQESPVDIPLVAPQYPLGAPQWSHVYAVKGKEGSVIVFVPVLSQEGSEWYVSSIIWRRYEGI